MLFTFGHVCLNVNFQLLLEGGFSGLKPRINILSIYIHIQVDKGVKEGENTS